MNSAIWWLRRDLRLYDNPALTAVTQTAVAVYPVFIFDPGLLHSPYTSEKRLAFLAGCLRQLDADLRQRGSRLIVRHGEPLAELTQLVAETEAEAIFAEEDFSPYARRRDEAIAKVLPLKLKGQTAVYPPATLRKSDGKPYTVYTPFSKFWQAHRPLPQPNDLLPIPPTIATPPHPASQELPAWPLPAGVPFPPGEAEAQRRLHTFAQNKLAHYAEQRDLPGTAGTAELSPYLRFGVLSPRQAVVTAVAHLPAKGAQVWLNELIWRDFYITILATFPHVRRQSFRPEFQAIPWRNDPAEFGAWCDGRTGYPIVDAAMRQLRQTGWMHNRCRMITASFLVKDLLIDWRWGEKWFMQNLVDGDPAANNGGWQWTAGTGTDAAPYFRIFNPTLQGQKFDPHGRYLRRWLPELAHLPDNLIHTPPAMADYPPPMVDHHATRSRTLQAYKQAA